MLATKEKSEIVRIRSKYCVFLFLLCCLSEVPAQSIRPVGVAEDSVIINPNKTSFKIDDLKLFIEQCDSALNSFGSHLVLIAEIADSAATDSAGYLIPSGNVVRVQSPESWPDYTTTSLIIYRDNQEHIRATQEVPISESGDWHNTYTHYFDNDGKTIGFKRSSGFFLGCPAEPSRETSLYIFDKRQT